MEFVQNNHGRIPQRRIGEELPRQYALRHKAEARLRTGNLLEPHLVPNRLADALPSPSSDATRRAAIQAARRRGSSTQTSPEARESKAGGTRVVLPAPARLGVPGSATASGAPESPESVNRFASRVSCPA
jgi:hypothetical protein